MAYQILEELREFFLDSGLVLRVLLRQGLKDLIEGLALCDVLPTLRCDFINAEENLVLGKQQNVDLPVAVFLAYDILANDVGSVFLEIHEVPF